MVKRKTVILKSRFNQTVISQIAEKLKGKLFNRIGFLKSKSSKIKLISIEKYYEQYLVIKGKYSLDHCKKLEYNLEVDKKAEKICILNKEFIIDKSNKLNSVNSAIVKIDGVAHFHYENEGEFVLDKKCREIESEIWEILLNEVWPKEKISKSTLKQNIGEIQISTEDEIDFLRSRLIKRPLDVGEVIKELFELNERKIIFYPMFKLEYQNLKNKKEAMAKINGITGDILITTFSKKNISGKFIEESIKITSNFIKPNKPQSVERNNSKTKIIKTVEAKETKSNISSVEKQKNSIKKAKRNENKIKENDLKFKANVEGEIFHVGNEVTAIIGDLEIPPETIVEDTLVVKGNFIIGKKGVIEGTIKALGNITIGDYSIIKGSVVSGGVVTVGSQVKIFGKIVSNKTIYSEENLKR
jgi:hypothetical protein